ncbi:TonB-dependent receptor [Formicincola oecophyllae]|uniref:TonB-dependent receptor n=1 Tax=Formicincola oecophyllae TaxID=2558361 RepID=A0A4Y6UA42_9PROT|nr:TonB-dependent receptor [Formicincola oecophyllae]QDH13326.2 TonB-dependent receptor [Formicincola oecophyllae]
MGKSSCRRISGKAACQEGMARVRRLVVGTATGCLVGCLCHTPAQASAQGVVQRGENPLPSGQNHFHDAKAKSAPKEAARAEHIIIKTGRLQARQPVQMDGATKTFFSPTALAAIPGGANASVSTVLLQAPGVVQDSFGQLHIRGDHGNVQYRINGVALPDGVSMFSQALTTRFAHSLSLTDGALPAQYGFRQAGVIEIDTRTGAKDPGYGVSLYGGARDYLQPAAVMGQKAGKWDLFLTADAVHNRVGIENPTPSFNAVHDLTNQYHVLGRLAYHLRPQTEFSFTGGVANSWFQLPNNPSQQHQFETPAWQGHAASAPASMALREHQAELGDFGMVSWKESREDVQATTSAVVRYSSLNYSPDWVGDLIYNGVAQQARRAVFSAGMQNDTTWHAAPGHTVRLGFQAYGERGMTKTNSQVFPEMGGAFGRTPVTIRQEAGKTGAYGGFYGQDEWRANQRVTLTYGFRFDGVDEYAYATQFSPRFALVWRPWKGGHMHLSYARYFTPPVLEEVTPGNPAAFNHTSGAMPGQGNSPVKAERSHYVDGGWTQTLTKGWTMTVDGYFKRAHNMLDDGQFGAPIILTAFNYRKGFSYGAELSTNFTPPALPGLNLYGNMGWNHAMGKDIDSSQWSFAPDDLAYIKHHWVHLDHEQRWTASAGGSYRFMRQSTHPFQLSATMVYGSGLRRDWGAIPNGGHVPQYATFNLGLVQDVLFSKADIGQGLGERKVQFRLDVINLFDKTYRLRDGSGIGVGAPQYGLRRTILGGISVRL